MEHFEPCKACVGSGQVIVEFSDETSHWQNPEVCPCCGGSGTLRRSPTSERKRTCGECECYNFEDKNCCKPLPRWAESFICDRILVSWGTLALSVCAPTHPQADECECFKPKEAANESQK